MDSFVPCPSCTRHARATEPCCPFCGAVLPLSLRQSVPRVVERRLGRAATLAFGAALAAAGCSEVHSAADAGGSIDAGAGSDAGQVVPLYGGPPVDAGAEDASAIDDGGPPGDDGGGVVPPYGTPARLDGGGFAPAYGTPPAES